MIAITFPLKTLIVRGLIRDVSMVQYDKANGEIHHKLIFNTNNKYPLDMLSHVNEPVFGALSLNHVTVRVPTHDKEELDAFIKYHLPVFNIPEATCFIIEQKVDRELVDHYSKARLAFPRIKVVYLNGELYDE